MENPTLFSILGKAKSLRDGLKDISLIKPNLIIISATKENYKVFETLSGQDVHPETSETAQNNAPNLELIKKKLVDGVKERIKQQPGFAGKRIPAEQIENLISELYPNWESYVRFTVIPASRTTLSEKWITYYCVHYAF